MTFNSEIKGNWNSQKTKLKTKFPQLTEKDLVYEFGRKEDMLTKLQDKLGKTKEELIVIINSL
jgi:uncharacterized protein YjbJ (UPF0337 family)